MAKLQVAVVVGSLRRESLTRKVANALIAMAPANLDCTVIEIGDLSLYNEDLDPTPPAAWTRFREDIKRRDAVLFLTPEYNRSIPGCLKNAIDVGSRPQGQSVYDGKPAGVVSVTPYKLGAFGANHALRQTFVFLNMPVMQQPEAYIGNAAELFDAQGGLKQGDVRTLLQKFMQSFGDWIAAVEGAKREDFRDFLKRREQVAAAYVNGDPAPLDAIVPRQGEASFFPPNGGSVNGAQEVVARYDRDAKSFKSNGSTRGTTRFDVLQAASDGNIAFWTGFQTAEASMGGRKDPVQMKLRITELFRFREGGWKLVHRHADVAEHASPDA